jgi:predicted ABC-type ATPase
MLQKPKLIVIGGPNGSGKTTITHQILKHEWMEGCVYINPDDIAKELGDWNNETLVLQAAKIATKKREQCLQNKQSLIFETVFSSVEKIDFLFKAIEQGYFIRFFFISTNHPSINASRIVNRVLEAGHDVPIRKIIDRYYKSITNCAIIAPLVDRLYIYDNSIENKNAQLLLRASNGVITKEYAKVNKWASLILNAIET